MDEACADRCAHQLAGCPCRRCGLALGTLEHCLRSNADHPSICSSLETQAGRRRCWGWGWAWAAPAVAASGLGGVPQLALASSFQMCCLLQVVHCHAEVVCPQAAAEHQKCFQVGGAAGGVAVSPPAQPTCRNRMRTVVQRARMLTPEPSLPPLPSLQRVVNSKGKEPYSACDKQVAAMKRCLRRHGLYPFPPSSGSVAGGGSFRQRRAAAAAPPA